MLVDDLIVLTGQSENLLNIYIRRADMAIKNYLNIDVDVETAYPDAVIEYVMECLNKKGNEGIKQFTQGSRQGTYITGLSDDVKALLPAPYIKMMG